MCSCKHKVNCSLNLNFKWKSNRNHQVKSFTNRYSKCLPCNTLKQMHFLRREFEMSHAPLKHEMTDPRSENLNGRLTNLPTNLQILLIPRHVPHFDCILIKETQKHF